MKTNIMRIAPFLVAVVICAWGTDVRAQATTTTSSSTSTNTATTVTTTKGAFTEFVPASETIVVRTETNTAPLRYVVTKQTTIVDEAGVPITVEKISPGSPLSVEYSGTGDRLVASRIVVQKAPAVATERNATTTTTTTTTRPLTDEEKKAVKKEVEKQKEKADEAKDKAEDDDE